MAPHRSLGDRALLDLVGDVMGLIEIEEFQHGVLRALVEVLPSQYISLNEMSPERVIATIVRPELDDEWVTRWGELGHENPLYRYNVQTGDGRPHRFSDVAGRAELEATRLYRELYAPLGVEHQIAFTLPSDAGRVVAIAMSRGERDYSDAERRFLERARPFLIQAYRNALACSNGEPASVARLGPALLAAGLTRREAEVMGQVARGASNRDVAVQLGVSDRTVQKHLEHVFAKLGVATRSEAAARTWELTRDL